MVGGKWGQELTKESQMKLTLALLASIAANLACSTIGDICSELWRTTGGHEWFYIGFGVNIFTVLFFMIAIRLGGLSITTAFVLIITILTNVGIGHFVFNESVNSVQWAGVILGIIAITLVLHSTKVSP